MTADRASKINDRRRTFFQKLQKFRRLQEIFTPGAARAVAAEEAVRDPDAPPKKAEEVRLYMPSDLPAWEQKHGCQRGVVAIESALRDRQCESAMIAIRSGLHTKRHLIGFRNTQVTGQVKATKARTLIAQVGERVDANAAKYRQGRKALQALVGEDDLPYLDHRPHCRELKPSHLTLANEEIESDTAARKKLSLLSAGKGARTPRHITGSSKHVLSWIWMVNGGPITDAKHEEEIHACTCPHLSGTRPKTDRLCVGSYVCGMVSREGEEGAVGGGGAVAAGGDAARAALPGLGGGDLEAAGVGAGE